MKRHANVIWQGGLKTGTGRLSTQSGTLTNTHFSFGMRFENERGPNPEELIAAAHASCFSMAFSAELEKAGLIPGSIDVQADVSLKKSKETWEIPDIELKVIAHVPNATEEQIETAANTAKENCPVSKLLNANIDLSLSIIKIPARTG